MAIHNVKSTVHLKFIDNQIIHTRTGNEGLHIFHIRQKHFLSPAVQFGQHIIQQKQWRITRDLLQEIDFRQLQRKRRAALLSMVFP